MRTLKLLAASATLASAGALANGLPAVDTVALPGDRIVLASVIQAPELEALLGSVQIVDIRGDKDAFEAGHIPGAVQIGYGAFRGPKTNPGALPELNALTQALSAAGLRADAPLVVAHFGENSTDFGAAARVYWTFKSLGFENLSILNGGTKGYLAAGFEAAKGAVSPVASNLELTFNDQWYASTETVKARIDSGQGRLLDSRTPAFYAGEAWHGAAKKPGILPGADNFAFTAFFDEASLKSQAEVNKIVAANGLDQAQTVSYCNTGHWAATNWFVLSEVAQIPEVTLYAESMVEWSNAELPMDNVPGAAKFALLKVKKWADGLIN